MKINIPASIGELFDKITILEIKKLKIKDKTKLKIVNQELTLLKKVVLTKRINRRKLAPTIKQLKNILPLSFHALSQIDNNVQQS